MKKHLLLSIFSLLMITAFSQERFFYATLSGANEVPANVSTASGVVILKFNSITKAFELFGNYNGLTTDITGSHIHQAATGVNGPVIVNLNNTGGISGVLSASGLLTAPQETALYGGNTYVNVHSSTFPGGEIRGQLAVVADGDAVFSNARLQGAQEVPPNGSTANGKAVILLELSTNKVFLTGSYTGLTTNISGSHIHVGMAGVNGGVILNLTNSGGTSGVIHGAGTFTDPQEESLINAGTYVNVHSTTYPGGEIRGQITTYSQQLFFGGRLSGASEVPANASAATGTVIVRYNRESNELELTGDYQGLTTAITGSHIHTGTAGVNGAVIVSLTNTGGTFGGLSATATLTESQEAQLLNTGLYVNIHSSTFPGGETRTQLFPTSAGSKFSQVAVNGTQEVPANASAGSGTATMLVDRITGQAYVTATFAGLGAPVTMAHVHRGLTGTNGPVIMPLSIAGTTAGTVSGSQFLNAAQVDSFINGFTYINIHTSLFPGGEVRGQLGNVVLPVKLASFNGFKQKNLAVLSWQSTTEENMKQYEVEQQNTNTGAWIFKTSVAANGNSAGQYKAEDVPLNFGKTFVNYRLRMVDKDGKFAYSPVVKIDFTEDENGLMILQNPVSNSLNYRVAGLPENSKAQVTVIDQMGRNLYNTMVAPSGNQTINTSSFNSGIYMLKVQSGNEVFIQRFLKQ